MGRTVELEVAEASLSFLTSALPSQELLQESLELSLSIVSYVRRRETRKRGDQLDIMLSAGWSGLVQSSSSTEQ